MRRIAVVASLFRLGLRKQWPPRFAFVLAEGHRPRASSPWPRRLLQWASSVHRTLFSDLVRCWARITGLPVASGSTSCFSLSLPACAQAGTGVDASGGFLLWLYFTGKLPGPERPRTFGTGRVISSCAIGFANWTPWGSPSPDGAALFMRDRFWR